MQRVIVKRLHMANHNNVAQYLDQDELQNSESVESQKKLILKLIFIYLCPLVSVFVALFCGRYSLTFFEVLNALFFWLPIADPVPKEVFVLVVEVRLPRALAAAAVGGALAASGAAFQGVFRNPLVNPGLLGVSNGAGFGASLAIVMFGLGAAVYPMAFIFGIIAVLASYWIARVYKSTPAIMLILGGTIVSSVFASLISLTKYLANVETQLPSIVYWLMGSLSGVTFSNFWAVLIMGIGVVILFGFGFRIDVLSMGDKEARSLGLEVNRNKAAVISAATLATAGAVCMAGVVGWIGLIVPHIGRMFVGSENSRLIPASVALGATLLVIVDTCSRCIWASEIPLGILTALIGAPFFVFLLKKTKGGGWR